MQNIPNTEVQVVTSKNKAATRKQAKWRQNSVTTDFLRRDPDDNNTRQCCNKNHNRNVVTTRKAGSQHQFEEATQHHCLDQENTVATEIQGRTQEIGRYIRLLAATETCNENSKLYHDKTFRSRLRRQSGPKI